MQKVDRAHYVLARDTGAAYVDSPQ
jgi:hypothetical protein